MAEIATIVTIASTLATVASAGLGVAQGMQASGAARIQAEQARVASRQADINARAEELRGVDEAQQIRRGLLATLATQNARYAAAGILAGEGTAQGAEEQAAREAERQLGLSRTTAALRADQQRLAGAQGLMRATLLEQEAGAARTGALVGGGIALLQGGLRTYDRLPGTIRPTGGP
jgi:hypothetical protein